MNFPDDLIPGDHCMYGKKPGDPFGAITALHSSSPAVHIEVYAGNGQSLASRNGIGVNIYPFRPEQLIAVLRPPVQYDYVEAFKWFNTIYDKVSNTGCIGRPYGWADLARFAGDEDIETQGWICSEFAALFDKAAGMYPFSGWFPAGLVEPGDFFKVKLFEWVWQDDSVKDFFKP